MAKFELKLPKMGESVAEATITSWLKEVGETIEADEAVLEIATDKVDSEVPSEMEGVLIEKLFEADDVVQVGETIAIIEISAEDEADLAESDTTKAEEATPEPKEVEELERSVAVAQDTVSNSVVSNDGRFYSPLVKNIAKAEGIGQEELDSISGTGLEGRVTKSDILGYIENRGSKPAKAAERPVQPKPETTPRANNTAVATEAPVIPSGEDEIVELSRMGKLVANHMVESVKTSVHVQSFIEVDVTNVWNWRKKVKDAFLKREGENLTFTPIFMEAIAKSLRDFPMINISFQDGKIIKKKHINLGMAAALPDGNLIVPVIKNADQLNLVGLTKKVNDLASRARANKLNPDDIQDGTYTVTNVGTFGSIMGTPIINQPQVAILALGAIRKVPAVIETPQGDFVGIRYKMFLSHSYDHRVVNGAQGGLFIKAVKDYLEAWDPNQSI